MGNKTYLVTGAAGFIGSFLSRALLSRGDNVIGIDNFHEYYSRQAKEFNLDLTRIWVGLNSEITPIEEIEPIVKLFEYYYERPDNPGEFTFQELDIRDNEGLKKLANEHKIDGIVHLAAMAGVGLSTKQPLLYTDINIMGSTNLLTLAKDFEIDSFVFGSSSSVYGEREDVPFKESDNVDNPESPYAATKRMQEIMNYTYHSLYGLNVINARIFGPIYGPLQRPFRMLAQRFINYTYNDKPMPIFGDGKVGARDTTYIDDEVRGLIACLDKCGSENGKISFDTINIGTGHAISPQEVADEVIKLVGKGEIDYIERPAGEVPITYADTKKAEELLGFKAAVDFETGLKRQVEVFLAMPAWYKEMEA
ncbi:MAG: GDP-mannose 4,6-dehydratase [Candidatus Dojkabacteria bacterium]